MWVVAGVLLGLVVLGALLGFHLGPHLHGAAGVVGVLAAAWLVFMAVGGRARPLLWVLLGADVVVSVGVGVLAWKALTLHVPRATGRLMASPLGAEGTALGVLDPTGVVRVNGEEWSAVAVNGTIPSGTRVQVVGGGPVRLEVWGEEALPAGGTGSDDDGGAHGAPRERRTS